MFVSNVPNITNILVHRWPTSYCTASSLRYSRPFQNLWRCTGSRMFVPKYRQIRSASKKGSFAVSFGSCDWRLSRALEPSRLNVAFNRELLIFFCCLYRVVQRRLASSSCNSHEPSTTVAPERDTPEPPCTTTYRRRRSRALFGIPGDLGCSHSATRAGNMVTKR